MDKRSGTARTTDQGYTLIRRWWPFGRKERLWHVAPGDNSPSRGWLITDDVVRELKQQVERG